MLSPQGVVFAADMLKSVMGSVAGHSEKLFLGMLMVSLLILPLEMLGGVFTRCKLDPSLVRYVSRLCFQLFSSVQK